jgi:hypothetical protein
MVAQLTIPNTFASIAIQPMRIPSGLLQSQIDATDANKSVELVYSLSRLNWIDGWWAWAIAVLFLAGISYLLIRLYRNDTAELAGATRATLIGLRVLLLCGLVFFLVGLERRSRQRVVRPSEVAVIVDTSQSMSLPQSDQPSEQSRMDAARQLISQSPLIPGLAEDHRVTLYTFGGGGELNEVLVSEVDTGSADSQTRTQPAELAEPVAQPVAIVGLVGLVSAALLMVVAGVLAVSGATRAVPPLLLASSLAMVVGGTLLCGVWSINTTWTLAGLVGLQDAESNVSAAGDQSASETPASENAEDVEKNIDQRMREIDWASVFVASAGETRIGDALRGISSRHDPTTLAGVLMLTDGENNAGTPPLAAAALIGRGGTAVYPIGLGSAKPPTNIRIVDLDVPRRVYPGDKFALNAVLQASGPQSMTVQVQLLDDVDSDAERSTAPEGDGAGATSSESVPSVIDSREVVIAGDGTLTGVQFEMEPASVGRRKLTIRVIPPADDQNELDNERQAKYEVVSRRLRVMLVAGGPMREYRFVRNLLFRDPSVEVDVWLQTGQSGMSQDADRVLTDFPRTAVELFEYDAILAFDPNWLMLDASQLDLIDQWLSRQAGGMALVSGPVYMPEWTRLRTDPRVEVVRRFFPVALSSRGPLLSTGRTGGDTAWPLEFAPDAAIADFLNIGRDADSGAGGWQEFGGIYDFVGVNEAKPGARVYAYFSDPSTAIDEKLPIYLASQFYGAGRVFFQGSGEMWRLRGVSDSFFDAYYTKLVRWVSEGRLLRDSNRGVLLVDRPRAMVGDTITVRAILTDEQFQPLRLPQVEANLLTPSGRSETVRLTPLAGEPREGTYSGRILAREAGAYELRITLGNALDEEVLRQSFQIGLPTLELERPRRNDEVLRALAATTGGLYTNLDGSSGSEQPTPGELVSRIEPQPQLTVLPGTPDRDFERRRNASLMWLLCSMLTMEWVIRRLHRLA